MVHRTIRVRTDGRNLMSSSEEETEKKLEEAPKKRVKKETEMHGATVVPEAAFLKHKRLLDKKF